LGVKPRPSAITCVTPGSFACGGADDAPSVDAFFEQATASMAANAKMRGRTKRRAVLMIAAALHRLAVTASVARRAKRASPTATYVTLTALFPSFPAERILYEDEDLVAIDKPVGMSTHAADPEKRDDAVSRLSLFLAERDGV